MKVKLIYNPVSGNGNFRNYLDFIIDRFQQKGLQIEPYRTKMDKSLDNVFSEINEKEYKKILVAGGDGTVNKVVNAMLKYNINLPLGIFPVGTANDYAQYFNLPNDIKDMVEILLRDNYTLSDIGQANDTYFINVASLGSLIDISQRTNTELKNTFGVLAYYINGISEIPNLEPINIKVTSNVMKYDDKALFMLIMNGKSAGGFSKISPLSSVNDGMLDVFIFKKCSVYELATLLLAVINGEHINNPNIIYFKTDSLTIDCEQGVGTDVDGEKGCKFPLNVKVIPQKIKVITRHNNEEGSYSKKGYTLYDIKKILEQVSNGLIKGVKKNAEINIKRNAVSDINKLIKELPKHNAFDYINKGSLSEEYFKFAEETLENGYLYIVLSSTGSPAGETISKVTNKHYSHSSLSFDEELKTVVSYNGGEDIYSPGLNSEMLEFFYKKEDANVLVYRIKASKEQKKQVLDNIRKINEEGSSYNVLGLFLPYSHKENIMFCSQFVYTMLKQTGLDYFDKKSEQVKPTDFVELDYERRLEFCGKFLIKDIIKANLNNK